MPSRRTRFFARGAQGMFGFAHGAVGGGLGLLAIRQFGGGGAAQVFGGQAFVAQGFALARQFRRQSSQAVQLAGCRLAAFGQGGGLAFGGGGALDPCRLFDGDGIDAAFAGLRIHAQPVALPLGFHQAHMPSGQHRPQLDHARADQIVVGARLGGGARRGFGRFGFGQIGAGGGVLLVESGQPLGHGRRAGGNAGMGIAALGEQRFGIALRLPRLTFIVDRLLRHGHRVARDRLGLGALPFGFGDQRRQIAQAVAMV